MQFVPSLDAHEEFDATELEPPSYRDPGRVMFYYTPAHGNDDCEIEVIDYDDNSSIVWMYEGGSIEYEIAAIVDLELSGFYVLEGVTGTYFRGDWFYGEDDYVEWDFVFCRRASADEIQTKMLKSSKEITQ